MLVIPIILTAVPLAPEIYSACLLSHGQPMGIRPLLGQQGDGRSHVNHQEALSGLALGLVTPRDLPRSNADGDVWLMSWLLLGFGRLRARLGHLEPTRRHMYLLYDKGIGRLRQDAQQIGFWGIQAQRMAA